jgi:hypothetical protein
MPHVEFRRAQFNVPPSTGRRTFTSSVNFSSNVIRAEVALNGFDLDFLPSGTTGQVDRHINVVEADTDLVSVSGTTVTVRLECQYADVNFDDPYQGFVGALVIAEVV